MKSLGQAVRVVLGLAVVYIIGWSFVEVGKRLWQQRESRQEKPVQLTILHWGDAAEDNILTTLLNQYMKEHPKVKITRINAGGSFDSKIKTMMSAGTPPDMFYLPTNIFPELAELKLVQPVDDYIAADREAGIKSNIDDYYKILLDAFSYDLATHRVGGGQLYGLPKDFTTAVFYVNVDLFNKAGVPVPYDGWTWDEFEDAMRKITALNSKPGFEGRAIYGGYFPLWPDTLRNLVWSFGGEFFGPEGFRDVVLDKPEAQAALEMICRVRFKDKSVYNPTGVAKDGGQEFFNGNIGCIGPMGRWLTPRYSQISNFKWDVVPVPYQKKEYQASQLFLTAWAMSADTPHKEVCWDLMKFLCGPEGAVMQSRLGLAIPPLKSVANSKDFLEPGGDIPAGIHSRVFLDLIPYVRIQQVPPEQEWGRILSDKISRSTQLNTTTPMEDAREIKAEWLNELDSPLRRQQWKPLNWMTFVGWTAAAIVTVVTLLWLKARREKIGPLDRAQARAGWAFIAPWLIGFLIFTMGPMLISMLLSFTRWTGMTPMNTADSVGFANYQQMFTRDSKFVKSLIVTGYFVILAVPIGQIAALAVAVLMNSKVRGITVFRTVYFVPSVVSGVALSVLWLQIFNNDYGILNAGLRPILKLFGTTPPNWFGADGKTWAIPAFVIMGLWGVGGGMIIYLAGLKGIPTSLYEAATIDGAGPARKFWNVTLPMLSPLIFYNLVMGIIGSFQVFTQAYVMTGGGPDNATLFYVLNLYRHAFEYHNMGYASALAWVLFVLVLVLTLLVFRGAKNLVYYEGLKS